MEKPTDDFFKQYAEKRAHLLEKDCDSLSDCLSHKWERLPDVDRLAIIRVMIEEKHCNLEIIMPYLFNLMKSLDPYYRYEAMNYIVGLDGKNQREFLIQIFHHDSEIENRNRALLLLAEIFREKRDIEILQYSLSVYQDINSTINTRLVAGAAMMFQLGISSDENGRPAFWNEDEEELQHPAFQRAIAETKEILRSNENR